MVNFQIIERFIILLIKRVLNYRVLEHDDRFDRISFLVARRDNCFDELLVFLVDATNSELLSAPLLYHLICVIHVLCLIASKFLLSSFESS